MKYNTAILSLALATTVVAGPTKKAKCGGPHGAPSYQAYPGESSTSSQEYPHATYSAVSTYGTVCTTTSTAVESTTETTVLTTTPSVVTTVTTETETQTTTETVDLTTSTLTSTSTVFETNTETDTATETSTSTVLTTVTETTTATVQPSAGFVPIQSKYPSSAQKRSLPPKVGDDIVRRGLDSEPIPSCTATVTDTTSTTETATVTSTTEAATPTTTSTELTTVTSTSTVLVTPADFTTTVMQTDQVSTTTTVTTTGTETTTSTTTEYLPATETYYAACGPDNILNKYNGGNVDNTKFTSDSFTTIPGVGSGYDCCVACLKDTTCYLAFFYSNGCQKLVKNAGFTCDPTIEQDQFMANSNTGLMVEVYNSNCGQYGYRPN